MRDNTPKEEMEEKNIKKKRPKRISKSEEEKRAQILNPILGEWVCVRNKYEEEDYYFIKHILVNEGKYSRIRQILISKYPEQDGVYEISDYEIGYIFDAGTLQKKIEFKLKKYDMTYGLYSENEFAQSYNQLITDLLEWGYITREELNKIKKDKNFHNTCSEVVLSFVRHFRKRDAN
jgi:hypothetical protein